MNPQFRSSFISHFNLRYLLSFTWCYTQTFGQSIHVGSGFVTRHTNSILFNAEAVICGLQLSSKHSVQVNEGIASTITARFLSKNKYQCTSSRLRVYHYLFLLLTEYSIVCLVYFHHCGLSANSIDCLEPPHFAGTHEDLCHLLKIQFGKTKV